MNLNNNTNKFIAYLKQDKKRIFILAIGVIGLILVMLSSFESDNTQSENSTLSEYESKLEDELSKMCSSIKGVGKCSVKVTFEEGERTEYRGSNVSASYPPKVLGIAVICDGADKDNVRADITECLTALFDIGANRISVLRMR